MSKRIFIAIDLPEEVNRQLSDYAEVLRDVRWYEPTQYHLTLKFVGDSDEEQIRSIEEKLAGIQHETFQLTVNKLGYFPPNRHPRVIWAGFESNQSLMDLQEKIESELQEVGIDKEDRAYTPHITLGKNKGVPRTRVEEFLEKRQDIYIPEITIKSFILYSSRLTPNGAVHTPERTYYLNDK